MTTDLVYCVHHILFLYNHHIFFISSLCTETAGYPSDAFVIPHSLTYIKGKDVVCVADREHGRIQCFNSGDGSYVDSYKRDIFGGRVFAVHYNPWNGKFLGR